MELKLEQFKLLHHKYKFISISTNRNFNNKKLSFSPIKMNDKIAILPIVIYNIDHFQMIENLINEKVTGIIYDNEKWKTSLNIEQLLKNKSKSEVQIPYYPSEITLNSFNDLFDAINMNSIMNCAVYGFGNLGTRITRSLLSRNQNVTLVSKNKKLADYEIFKSSLETQYKNNLHFTRRIPINNDIDYHIGCTNGFNIVDQYQIEKKIMSNKLIDVGGNNFTKKGIEFAEKNNNFIFSISIDSALLTYVENQIRIKQFLEIIPKSRKNCGHTLVTQGYIANENEILVDNAFEPKKILDVSRFEHNSNQDLKCNCKTI